MDKTLNDAHLELCDELAAEKESAQHNAVLLKQLRRDIGDLSIIIDRRAIRHARAYCAETGVPMHQLIYPAQEAVQ